VTHPAPNEPTEVQATHAWEVEQRILATARILREAWVDLARDLYELVVLRDVEPDRLRALEPSKVQWVLPAISRKAVSVDRALADAEVLSRNDLRERYAPRGAGSTQTAAGSAPDDSTGYEATAEPARVPCPTCGSYVTEAQITRGPE
jgi:hypothetical protein